MWKKMMELKQQIQSEYIKNKKQSDRIVPTPKS